MSQASIGFPWFVVSVFVVGFLPGMLLLIAGRRGKRVDDHPVCRGCGFDLFGTHEPIPDKHPKCPECGTRREPKLGNRQRRGKLALAGIFLMLTSIGVAGVWGYGRFGAAQLAQIKPMWLLRFEARSGTSNAADIALGEMIDRFQNGQITPATAELLFDDAVAHGPAGNPALVNAALGSKWDTLAAELMIAGHGTAAERVEIAKSWVQLSINLRPLVRQEQNVPMDIERFIYGPPGPFHASIRISGATVRHQGIDRVLNYHGGGGGSTVRGHGASSGTGSKSLVRSVELPGRMKSGKHQIEFKLPITLSNGWNGSVWATWTETLTADFEIVDPPVDPIGLIRNPAAAAAFESGASVQQNRIEVGRRNYGSVTFDFDTRPLPVAYRVFLRKGHQRWRLCTVNSEAAANGMSLGTGGNTPDELEDGAIVDLVFEPDPDVARQTTDLTEILDHAFVIPDVKIVRPATSP